MRDELETLEKELKRTAPKPKPAVRKQTLSKAMEAFDRHHQGLSVQPRQTGQEVNVMSWLKNRIHPLQPRYLVAALRCAWRLPGSAVIYWLPVSPTEPAETRQIARLQPEPSAASAAGESLKPPQETARGEAASHPPVAESAPALPEKPAGRSAKEAAQAQDADAEPAPVAATEGVTVDVPSEGAVLASEAATCSPMRIPTSRLSLPRLLSLRRHPRLGQSRAWQVALCEASWVAPPPRRPRRGASWTWGVLPLPVAAG